MGKYILRRLAQILITLLVFQLLLFVILTTMPGDVTNRLLTNPDIPPEVRERVRTAMGLNDPVYVQFGRWFRNFVTFDLGVSFSEYPKQVTDILAERIPRTLILFLTATIVQFVVGFSMGRALAWRRGGAFEYGTTLIGAGLYTVFTPWFALLMIFIFGAQLRWLPLGKFLDPNIWRTAEVPVGADSNSKANYIFMRMLITASIALILWVVIFVLTRKTSAMWRRRWTWIATIVAVGGAVGYWALSGFGYLAWDILKHTILPVVTITLVGFAGTMLITRQTMLETLREDYIMTARAKGLPERVVRDRHASRNAMLPVFTSLIIGLPFVISGGIITETIFSWPGMGLTLLNATLAEDIPLVMGTLSFIGMLSLTAHLIADVLYAFLDPRIRYT